jgi:hypothetical protein
VKIGGNLLGIFTCAMDTDSMLGFPNFPTRRRMEISSLQLKVKKMEKNVKNLYIFLIDLKEIINGIHRETSKSRRYSQNFRRPSNGSPVRK